MTLNLIIPPQAHTDFTPRITVIGVGGGGTNAVDNMIALNLQGVEFVVANTDAQQLMHSRADRRIQLGPHITQGLGAGAKPEIGKAAAEEAADELYRHLDGAHMVFITAGMGGGTGTGAAPVIARMARERNILTVGVVTKPFGFEGARRGKAADQGIEELQQYVDTLIVIPNQNLFRMANERTTWKDAFKMADQVLYMGVRGVTDLMMVHGLINLDFADIRAVMAEMGKAMMGTGEADGEDRARRAAEAAINNPLLEDTSMAGAKGLLINITGGEDLTLYEVDQAVTRIREEVDDDANVIFGSAIDESLNGRIRVSVVATGIDSPRGAEARGPRLVAVNSGAMPGPQPIPVPGGANQAAAGAAGAAPAAAPQPAVAHTPIPQLRHTTAVQEVVDLEQETRSAPPPVPPTFRAPPKPIVQPVLPPVATTPPPAPAMDQGGLFVPQPRPVMAPPEGIRTVSTNPMTPPAPESTGQNLFRRVTGVFRRQSAPQHEAPVMRQPVEPPLSRAVAMNDLPAHTPSGEEPSPLEIPTFLRRQSSAT